MTNWKYERKREVREDTKVFGLRNWEKEVAIC